MPLPKKLLERGVRDMVRICDGRMSGTAYGTVVLHVSPEAAAGGPLGLVRNGDVISLDVDRAADRRRGARGRALAPTSGSGDGDLLRQTRAWVGAPLRRPCPASASRRRPRLPRRIEWLERQQGVALTKTAVITGGASGLGAATAERLRAAGCASRNARPVGRRLRRRRGRRRRRDPGSRRRSARSTSSSTRPGSSDPNKPLLDTTPDEWRTVFDVNVVGTVKHPPRLRPGDGRSGLGSRREHRQHGRQGRQSRTSRSTRPRRPRSSASRSPSARSWRRRAYWSMPSHPR